MDEAENDLSSCAICCEELLSDLQATPCGHVFHSFCIFQALSLKSHCPICRASCHNDTRCRDAPIKLYLQYQRNKPVSAESIHETQDLATLKEMLLQLKQKLHETDIKFKSLNEEHLVTKNKYSDAKLKIAEINKAYSNVKKNDEEKGKICEQLKAALKRKKEELESTRNELQDLRMKLTSYEVAGILLVGNEIDRSRILETITTIGKWSESSAVRSLKDSLEYQAKEYKRLLASIETMQKSPNKKNPGSQPRSLLERQIALGQEKYQNSFPLFDLGDYGDTNHLDDLDNLETTSPDRPVELVSTSKSFRICSLEENKKSLAEASFPLGKKPDQKKDLQ
eukprot:TRINITY_DN9362_c0_g1_i3.p1 TRINITY_DN9362_c0_g1~~TRINITY_DN9362_c0_g1_i3.p1  ORF type:complete len:339 (+),score=66.53 TRINITY_DN9362_c0_g1_i3:46-1062(+)